MRRFVLLALAVALGAAAVFIAVSGGVRATVGGFRVSARSPTAAGIAALVAGGLWFALARRRQSIAADLDTAWHAIDDGASRAVGVVALIAAIVAAVFATRSAAGADASGYLSQAAMWTTGQVRYVDTLAPVINASEPWLTTPLGWRPAATAGRQSPTYAPGLPLLMAIPHAMAGIDGANAIVIAGAAIAVWATGMIAGGVAGIIAAVLLASAPAFQYQSIQPMSDVPVTAAWVLCFLLLSARKPSWGAGMACAIAVLIRPNLAPLAIVPLVIAGNRVSFAAPVAAAGLVLAFMQWLWYGSPFRSGYGSAADLFDLANIGANARHYVDWLVATSPVLLFALPGCWRMRRDSTGRALCAFAVLVIMSYLVYAVFDHWSYLRFLLPAMAVLAVPAGAELAAWIERWPIAARAPLLMALLLALSAHGAAAARSLETYKQAEQSRRVAQVAGLLDRTAPPSAVIVAGEQSGSMRYYTGRPILRWEAAQPAAALHAAIDTLERAGRPVYIVLDAWENEPFRARFAAGAYGALDWPAMLEAGTSHRTRLWRVADRARFLAGENLTTLRLP